MYVPCCEYDQEEFRGNPGDYAVSQYPLLLYIYCRTKVAFGNERSRERLREEFTLKSRLRCHNRRFGRECVLNRVCVRVRV